MPELRPVFLCTILATLLIANLVLSALDGFLGNRLSPSRWIGNYKAVSHTLLMTAKNAAGSIVSTGQRSPSDTNQTLPVNQTLVATANDATGSAVLAIQSSPSDTNQTPPVNPTLIAIASNATGSAVSTGQRSPSDTNQTLPVNQTLIAAASNTTVSWDLNNHTYVEKNLPIQQEIGLNLPAIPPLKQCLKFIHIPKTAGTKIESMGGWGINDGNLTCLGKKTCRDFAAVRECCYPLTHQKNARCSLWHTPPADDPLLAWSYSRCKTFCVVRHPVDRWISEYEWHLAAWTNRRGRDPCSLKVLNEYSEELMNYPFSPALDYRADCHRVPQSKYVISNDGQRLHCNHVIRFENVTAEFNALMKAYNLQQRMDNQKINSISTRCKINIPEKVKNWIYANYQSDFQLFGYSL